MADHDSNRLKNIQINIESITTAESDTEINPPELQNTATYPNENCRICNIAGWKGGKQCRPCKLTQ